MYECFEAGEKVTSAVYGYYFGVPGIIIEPAQWQYGSIRRFVVELDTGIRIVLRADWMQKINE